MKTLVVILTHPEARGILFQNWPWLTACGCDIAVVGHQGQQSPFETYHTDEPGFKRTFLQIGGPPNSTPHMWLDRFINVLEWCAWSPETKDYTHYLLTESDSIFLKPVPDLPDGIVATLAGHKSDGFHANDYFHAPWVFSASAAEDFLRRARIMLNFDISEHGFIDRFLGAYSELYGVPIQQMNTFSVNSVDTPEKLEAAKKAVAAGAWFVHGVKTPAQLAEVISSIPTKIE